MPRDCTVIMAREPRAGAVKSRLAATIGAAGAAALYEAFLQDTLDACRLVGGETLISFADDAPSAAQFFQRFAPSLRHVAQPEADFGARLASAMYAGFAMGCKRVAIIGSDIPHIAPAWISDSFDGLDAADLVLGPTLDGGYYLIAVKEPTSELFTNIDWSTGREFAQTMERAALLGLSTTLVETTLDIDEREDLDALRTLIASQGPEACPATALALARLDAMASPVRQSSTR